MSLLNVSCILLVSIFVLDCQADFDWPRVKVQRLQPKGFKVWITDRPGISLFAFHGKINEELDGREAGTFSVDINSPKNNEWTYINKDVDVKPGDILYFWTYVDYHDGERKLGYPLDDQSYTFS